MKIGIFTVSTPIGSLSPQRAIRAIKFLESKGHQVIKGELFDQNQGYRSGDIQARGAIILESNDWHLINEVTNQTIIIG